MEHIDKLVNWLKSYRPEELFDEKENQARITSGFSTGDKRMAKIRSLMADLNQTNENA